ncbi:hypothetical protein ANO11243_044140 [Dothideomycetidae sp. 11243]|nr:hypothetical protein ANO11243_044140 [fungal sp. No.11243]
MCRLILRVTSSSRQDRQGCRLLLPDLRPRRGVVSSRRQERTRRPVVALWRELGCVEEGSEPRPLQMEVTTPVGGIRPTILLAPPLNDW